MKSAMGWVVSVWAVFFGAWYTFFVTDVLSSNKLTEKAEHFLKGMPVDLSPIGVLGAKVLFILATVLIMLVFTFRFVSWINQLCQPIEGDCSRYVWRQLRQISVPVLLLCGFILGVRIYYNIDFAHLVYGVILPPMWVCLSLLVRLRL